MKGSWNDPAIRLLFARAGKWTLGNQNQSHGGRCARCRLRGGQYRLQGMADPGERVEKLVTACEKIEQPLVLVGSSMGGHVATAAAERAGSVTRPPGAARPR